MSLIVKGQVPKGLVDVKVGDMLWRCDYRNDMQVPVVKVGRKNIYVEAYGRESVYRIADGTAVAEERGYGTRLLTTEQFEDRDLTSTLTTALTKAIGDTFDRRPVTVDQAQRILAILEESLMEHMLTTGPARLGGHTRGRYHCNGDPHG